MIAHRQPSCQNQSLHDQAPARAFFKWSYDGSYERGRARHGAAVDEFRDWSTGRFVLVSLDVLKRLLSSKSFSSRQSERKKLRDSKLHVASKQDLTLRTAPHPSVNSRPGGACRGGTRPNNSVSMDNANRAQLHVYHVNTLSWQSQPGRNSSLVGSLHFSMTWTWSQCSLS